MKRLKGLLISAMMVCMSFAVLAKPFSKDQVYLKKVREERGLIVSVRANISGFIICRLRFRQDELWIVMAAKETSRPLLLREGRYHEPSLACSEYDGDKPHGAMWRTVKYKSLPEHHKLIELY
ncbi:hypothetical protein [Motilimonas pumila]|uniref:Uncharacterized protein n=1 Tax=Motilimonas pumila TaxID=2303987 RepID=A0A418YDN3_9GAMM|nr:hypothetical protein [Motilimonas pumila]RJG42659.1 hypothetical protein D1Z90_12385 [Motilimonas pumila]